LHTQCGDPKSGRITVKGVEAYLDKNVLVFDRELLANLFAEADFRREGSLDARALKAALSGWCWPDAHLVACMPACCCVFHACALLCLLAARYPKRQLHREWRALTALLLGVPELVLAEDIKHPKVFEVSRSSPAVLLIRRSCTKLSWHNTMGSCLNSFLSYSIAPPIAQIMLAHTHGCPAGDLQQGLSLGQPATRAAQSTSSQAPQA
jgi:hypothetical protein